MENKLKAIINYYGIFKQLKQFNSEIYELNEAILLDQKDNKNHIIEELADVMVMIEQLILYYNIDQDDIIKIMEKKIDRQINRISEERGDK